MKATEFLQRQHREIEQLLERHRSAAPEEARAAREELASLLVAHDTIEQEIFYPALRGVAPGLVLESLEEHALMDFALARSLGAKLSEEDLQAKAAVLAQVVLTHLRREEAEVFSEAESGLTDQQLEELGDKLSARFDAVHAKGFLRPLAKAVAASAPRIGASTRKARARKTASARKTATTRRGPAKSKAAPPPKRAPAKRTGTRKGAKATRSSRTNRRAEA